MSSGRSGSNFLITLLESHPSIVQLGEVIGESHLKQADVKEEILASGPVTYVKNCFKRKKFEFIVGIKILYHNVDSSYAEKWGVQRLPEVLEFLKSNKDIRIIHMKRGNRLKHLVSVQTVKRTKQFSLSKEKNPANDIQFELSPDDCSKMFNEIAELERKCDEDFRDHKYLEVYYEDIVSNKEFECNRILDFLGVRRQPIKSRLLKQNKKTLPDIIKNYKALKEHYAGTDWERFFID